MPKSSDKTKGALKRRKASGNSAGNNDDSDNGPASKQKKPRKKKSLDPDDGIAMSKQLAGKVQKGRQTRSTRSTTRNIAPRVCGNGKPMPSLADLEKMYEDSDYDTDSDEKPSIPADVLPVRCVTPDGKRPVVPPEKLMSPTTLKNIASKVIDILETGTISLLDDDGPPPPVIPQKKPKKPDAPYIVGCKDRPQVPEPCRARIGVGETKYGVECHCPSSDDDDCDCPKKRRRRGEAAKISKSIFNPKSEEIAAALKENERIGRTLRGSRDSCETVSYEYTDNSPSRIALRPFSPLPSTSKDCETILKNEQLFSESLSNDSHGELEIIEVPIETIVVEDGPVHKPNLERYSETEDDVCVLVESQKTNNNISLIDLDEPKYDFYNNINTLDLTEVCDNDLCEIIDVDDVIAENQALMKKYKKEAESKNVVTLVSPDAVAPDYQTEVVISSNTSVPIPDEIVINTNARAGPVQTSQQSNSSIQQNNPPGNIHITPQDSTPNNRIAEVITNFFNNPEPSASCSHETIDLTSMEGGLINKIVSMLSSVESFIRSQSTRVCTVSSQINPGNDSVIDITSPVTNKTRTNQLPPGPQIVPAKTRVIPSQQKAPGRIIECPICMESLSNSSVASTLCGHVFCMECIKASIRANGKRCPTCRKQLKGVGYHQLFL